MHVSKDEAVRRTKQEAMATRSAILDAAEAVFHRQGVSQTTLADIAAAAAVTRGAIYWHFANKADLFNAMQDRAWLPQEEFFHGRGMTSAELCLDVLYETTIETIRSFAADQRAKRVYTIILLRCEYVGEMSDALLRCRDADSRMRQTILEVFERARSKNQLRPRWTPVAATNAYVCSMVGLFSEAVRPDDDSFPIVETGISLMDSLFASYRAEETAFTEGTTAAASASRRRRQDA